MHRLAHLEALYLKVIYTMIAEEDQREPSPAVLNCCSLFKTTIKTEYDLLARRINHPSSQAMQ